MKTFKIGMDSKMILFGLENVLDFPHTTSFEGGYAVKGVLSIHVNKYSVNNAEAWFTTGQLYQLFHQLKEAYEKLEGMIIFSNYDDSIYFEMLFNRSGQIDVSGYFQEYPSIDSRLIFEFQLDQSYIPSTLKELKEIIDVYGGMKGIN